MTVKEPLSGPLPQDGAAAPPHRPTIREVEDAIRALRAQVVKFKVTRTGAFVELATAERTAMAAAGDADVAMITAIALLHGTSPSCTRASHEADKLRRAPHLVFRGVQRNARREAELVYLHCTKCQSTLAMLPEHWTGELELREAA
jgi:hypothetical protein